MPRNRTLAERLGHPADAKLLIVNADDFGSSSGANAATLRAFGSGIATSATLMVPCPWARAAARLAETHGLDVGVHLTLTCEYPGYRWRSLTGGPTLHDADGFMAATAAQVHARADPAEAYAECRAQVEQAMAWGLDPTHLDSHMGTLQTDPRYFAIYLRLAEEFDLPLRMPGERGDAQLGFGSREQARAAGVVFNDHFLSPWPRDTREVLAAGLPGLVAGVTEAYAHPVDDGPELRAYDPTHADIRARDAAAFVDPDLAEIIARCGIAAIGWRPLRDLQRAEKHRAERADG